ncbi:MAG TPA: peptidase M4 [Candidatus Tenderia electrophaga]|uniref:Peptidase M4 n=1 Tax=Candidatus Tenderia electrophaga TaxID=1748243 RepID=A0A832N6W6_9GAMM|nr:peptidase M4 [Candidatus Tenderia electrophaga]
MKKNCLLLLCLLLPAVAVADSGDDHESAKRLREAGEIVSLEKLFADVRNRHSGRVFKIELEHERGQYVYEIEMVDDEGKVHEYFYDAGDGRLLWEETGDSGEHR